MCVRGRTSATASLGLWPPASDAERASRPPKTLPREGRACVCAASRSVSEAAKLTERLDAADARAPPPASAQLIISAGVVGAVHRNVYFEALLHTGSRSQGGAPHRAVLSALTCALPTTKTRHAPPRVHDIAASARTCEGGQPAA